MPDRNDRYVFMHIPKTAGMSMRVLLGDIFGPESVSPAGAVRNIGPEEVAQLGKFSVIAEHISWRDVSDFFPDRKVFTILRDPIDRCLSIYGYFRQLTHLPLLPLDKIRGLNDSVEATSLARQLEPEDFFRSEHPHIRQNLENRMVWQLGYRAAVERRGEMRPREALGIARRNLRDCHFVGFYESLAPDTERLREVLTGEPRVVYTLPKVNETLAPLRKGDIGSSVRKTIERLTELDRELYDAALELDHAVPANGRLASGVARFFRRFGQRSSA